jgi:phage tail sheath protein FI
MIMHIRRGIKKMMTGFLMEQNNSKTRKQVTSAVTAYLNDIKSKDGLYDFAVLCDDSNNSSSQIDNYELHLELVLKSSKVAEYVYVAMNLVKTGDAMTF